MDFDPQYFVSEQYLHDDILKEAERSIINTVPEAWKAHGGKVQPFVISWPQEPVVSDDGVLITDHIVCEIPEDKTERMKAVLNIIKRTKPYALLMGERLGNEVVLIFETKNGTRSWRYPIKKHGRTPVLGKPSTRDDVDCIGILWRAKKAKA